MLGDDNLLVSKSFMEDLNGLLIIGGGERESGDGVESCAVEERS